MTGFAEALAIAAMRRQRGQPVTLRRMVSGMAVDVTVVATVMGYQPNEITGGVMQGDRKAKLSDNEIVAAGWPGPPRKGDILMIDGRTFTAITCDTVKMGSVVLSHTMQVRGAS